MKYSVYFPKYFAPEELVPPECVSDWLYVCDGRMLRVLDMLRTVFGKITINNYAWGGNLKYAGFRPSGCKVGNKTSQHRFGRAYDLKFNQNVDSEDVIKWLLESCPHVTCIRKYSWGLHIDNRNVSGSQAVVWRQ